MKAWPVVAILVIQAILFLGHWFVYSTFIAFCPGLAPATELRVALFVLAFSFVFASLISFRFSNPVVGVIYWVAAVWLGFLNFFFWGSIVIRMGWLAIKFSNLTMHPSAFRTPLAATIYIIAALTGIYGLINARIIRIRRILIKIPESACVLARSQSRSDERLASRADQRCPFLPTHGRGGLATQARHRLHSRRPF